MLLLIILTVMVMSTFSEDQYYLIATALFYTDSAGRALLVTGPIPKDTDKTIQGDVQQRFPINIPMNVVPAYKRFEDVPNPENILKDLKQKYSTVFIAEIPQAKVKNILKDMRKSMPSSLPFFDLLADLNDLVTKKHLIKRTPKNSTVPVPLSADDDPEDSEKKSTSCDDHTGHSGHPSTTKALLLPKDFVLNDIYYGIEKKCANWNDVCDLQGPKFLQDIPSTHFKFGLSAIKQPVVQWLP